MPITTYHHRSDIHPAIDRDICEALSECHPAPLVSERRFSVKTRWWQRHRYECLYEILWPLSNAALDPLDLHEYQIVNFYREPPYTSINTFVPKALVLAYLYGYLARKD